MIYHISHSADLDGIGSHVVASYAFREEYLQGQYNRIGCNYNEVDEKIAEVLEVASTGILRGRDTILITDISPQSGDIVDKLEKWYRDGGNLILVDHHATALERLEEYEWAHINIESCATLNLYHYLSIDAEIDFEDEYLHDFAFLVNDYDLWIHDDPRSKQLNLLRIALGHDEFFESFAEDPWFDPKENPQETEAALIACMERLQSNYVKRALEHVYHRSYDDKSFALVFAEQYCSDIGDTILQSHPEYDFVVIANIGARTVSLRSRAGGVDVGKIAKEHQGGGHAVSAGFPLRDEDIKEFVGMF